MNAFPLVTKPKNFALKTFHDGLMMAEAMVGE
jgi:hypothetical protein